MPINPTNATPVALWGYAELAEYVNVPVRTLRRWTAAGTGPRTTRLGRHVRFREVDVAAWIDTRSAAL